MSFGENGKTDAGYSGHPIKAGSPKPIRKNHNKMWIGNCSYLKSWIMVTSYCSVSGFSNDHLFGQNWPHTQSCNNFECVFGIAQPHLDKYLRHLWKLIFIKISRSVRMSLLFL